MKLSNHIFQTQSQYKSQITMSETYYYAGKHPPAGGPLRIWRLTLPPTYTSLAHL